MAETRQAGADPPTIADGSTAPPPQAPRAVAPTDAGRGDDTSVVTPLVLAGLLALVVTYAVVNLVVGALGEKFRDDLTAARLSANKAMVRLEENNLRLLRQIVFTEGLEDAVADGDVDRLERLLAPIVANARVPYVDVVRADGTELLALRAPDLGLDAGRRVDPNVASWPPVQAVLRGSVDDQGDKHAEIVSPPWGPLFLTASPIRRDGRLQGAVAVAYPLEETAARLSDDAGSHGVTLYRPDGSVLATTVRANPDALQRAWRVPLADAERILQGDQLLLRQVGVEEGSYVETIGALAVRRRAVLLLGLSSPAEIIERSSAQARNWMLVIFGLAVAGILGLRLAGGRRAASAAPARAGRPANGAVRGHRPSGGDGTGDHG